MMLVTKPWTAQQVQQLTPVAGVVGGAVVAALHTTSQSASLVRTRHRSI
jgi:hypothetical protein